MWRARRILRRDRGAVAYVGLRRNEALYLQVADLDLERGSSTWSPIPQGKAQDVRLGAAGADPAGGSSRSSASGSIIGWTAPRGTRMPEAMRLAVPDVQPQVPVGQPDATGPGPSTGSSRRASAPGVPDITFQMLRRSAGPRTPRFFFGIAGGMIQRVLRHTTSATTEAFYRKADVRNMTEAVKDIQF